MLKPINLQKDYTQNSGGYQLKLPLNIETIIPEDDSVRLLSQFVEAMDLTDLYSTYERINSVSPRTLLKISYIKPANYEISKTRKYRNDIGKIENMEYDAEADIYTCRNNKKLTVDQIRPSKSKTGYVSEKTIYKCENCDGCPYKKECIKGNNCKTPLEEADIYTCRNNKKLTVDQMFPKHF